MTESVDVARVMEEVRERVRQKRESGFYSEEEVRRVAQMELEVTEVAAGFHSEIEDHLAALNDAWDTTAEPVITSHRKVVGPLVVNAKRVLSRVTRPYIGLMLARQVAFNSRLLHLLNAFVLPVRDQLRDGLLSLQRKVEEISLATHERFTVLHAEEQDRQRELAQRLERLVTEVAHLRVAVERNAPGAAPAAALPSRPAVTAAAGSLPADAYVRFEDRHRGSREEIRHRQRGYLDLFPEGPVLDIGCGRGEFLELCREAKVEARGVDADPGMVRACQAAGLDVVQADVLAYLETLADGSLGGVFCSQVIEHLSPDAFVALARLAHAKLRPGGVLLCETPNPTCLTVFSGAFYVDLTHIKPIHPEAAVFVFEAVGFGDVEVRYVNPCPLESKLQPLEPLWYMRRYEEAFLRGINDNFGRLNDLLWGAQDYAVIGRRR